MKSKFTTAIIRWNTVLGCLPTFCNICISPENSKTSRVRKLDRAEIQNTKSTTSVHQRNHRKLSTRPSDTPDSNEGVFLFSSSRPGHHIQLTVWSHGCYLPGSIRTFPSSANSAWVVQFVAVIAASSLPSIRTFDSPEVIILSSFSVSVCHSHVSNPTQHPRDASALCSEDPGAASKRRSKVAR